MLSLILALLIGLGVAFFALQNTMQVPFYVGQYMIPSVPLYTLVIASLVAGVLIAWLLSLFGSLSSLLMLRGKDHALQAAQRRIRDLEDQNKKLEDKKAVADERIRHEELDRYTDEDTRAVPRHHSLFGNFFHRAV